MPRNILVYLGVLLILAGLAYPHLGATVYYEYNPDIQVTPGSPSGTISEPTVLTPGLTTSLRATIRVVNLDAPSCTVAISDTDYQDSISIPIYTHFTEGQYTYYVMRKDGWTIPSLAEDTVLEFTFTGSSEGLTHQASSYAIIGGPDGDFYLNGELATKTSSHTVTDPALTLKFQASKDGGLIDSVFIQVYQQTSTGGWQQIKTISMSETVQDSTWEASYTLPDHGVYKINGFFDVGTKTYQKMSVISGYKTQAAGLVDSVGGLGYAMILLGIFVMGVGVWRSRE